MIKVDDITGSNHDNYSQSGLANLLFIVWSLMTCGYSFFVSFVYFGSHWIASTPAYVSKIQRLLITILISVLTIYYYRSSQ